MPLTLMGKKQKMVRLFDEMGRSVVCTVIEAPSNVVVQRKTIEKDGYSAVQLGAEKALSKGKKVTKPLRGHFAKRGVEPHRHLAESRLEEGEEFDEGQEIGVDYFSEVSFALAMIIS